jgi:hypothetical protein
MGVLLTVEWLGLLVFYFLHYMGMSLVASSTDSAMTRSVHACSQKHGVKVCGDCGVQASEWSLLRGGAS